jgi:hypothetical protein
MIWTKRNEKVMQNEKNLLQRDELPENFNSLEEFWRFWDVHSSADYEDLMEKVEAEIDLSSSRILPTTQSFRYTII